MEQILLSQLSSIKQTSFHLVIRANSKKIMQFRKELAQFLTTNSITVDIIEKEDNLLTGEKLQLISETAYSNSSRTIESIYTGGYNPIIFQYVLNHCKQKVLMGSSDPLPEGTFKFKIQPFIRIESVIPKGKSNNRTSKLFKAGQEEEEELQSVTQRNSRKSNRHVKSSRKNEEDHSAQHLNHEYHGRKCYCCRNRSNEDSELQDEFSIFTRMPKKSIAENKQNSSKKPIRVSDFQPVIKRTSPQPLAHQLSVRGTSSQSDRNQKSPNLYFRKHLHTLANKKQGEDSNRHTNLAANGEMEKAETLHGSQSNKWIKTKRNGDPLAKTCEVEDDKMTHLKRQSSFSKTASANNDNVFRKAFKPRLLENKGEQSDLQSMREPQNSNQRQNFLSHPHQIRTKPIQHADQRYSQMVAPHESKIEIMGGYSIDQKSNKNIGHGVQRKPHPIHQRNESLQSIFKNKKDLDPIEKIKRTNQAKIRNNEEAPIILNKLREKTSPSANKSIPQRQKSINIQRSLNKNNQNASSNRLASNRIKKIPITQKMQMMKQGHERTKNDQKEQQPENAQIMKKGQASMKDNKRDQSISAAKQSNKVEAIDLQQKRIQPSNAQNNIRKKSPNLPQRFDKSVSKNINLPKKQQRQQRQQRQQKQVIVNEQQPKNGSKQNDTKPNELLQHDDDNFSVTQQRINNYPQPQPQAQSSHKSSSNREVISRPKPQNDLASTIKEINYEQQATKQLESQSNANIDLQAQNELIPTCRTIPLRNDSSEPKYETQNPTEAARGLKTNRDEVNELNSGQRQFFDDLLDKGTEQEQVTPKISIKEQSLIETRARRFHTCDSGETLDNNPPNLLNPTSHSDILQETESNPHQEAFHSELCDQSQPSEFSSTAQLCVNPSAPKGKNNRFSIDGQLLSPHAARKSHIVRSFANNQQSQNRVQDANLQQFERELFDEAPISDRSETKETQQAPKGQKEGLVKDFLRLETIDEVNESIYRQNEKKEMEERLNSVSIASNASSCKLKESLSNSSSKMVSQAGIDNERNTKRNAEEKVQLFESADPNKHGDCKSKQEVQSNQQKCDVSQKPSATREIPQRMKSKVNSNSSNQYESQQQSNKLEEGNEQLAQVGDKQPSIEDYQQTMKVSQCSNQNFPSSQQKQQSSNEFHHSSHKIGASTNRMQESNKINQSSNQSNQYPYKIEQTSDKQQQSSVKIIQSNQKISKSEEIEQSFNSKSQSLENRYFPIQKVQSPSSQQQALDKSNIEQIHQMPSSNRSRNMPLLNEKAVDCLYPNVNQATVQEDSVRQLAELSKKESITESVLSEELKMQGDRKKQSSKIQQQPKDQLEGNIIKQANIKQTIIQAETPINNQNGPNELSESVKLGDPSQVCQEQAKVQSKQQAIMQQKVILQNKGKEPINITSKSQTQQLSIQKAPATYQTNGDLRLPNNTIEPVSIIKNGNENAIQAQKVNASTLKQKAMIKEKSSEQISSDHINQPKQQPLSIIQKQYSPIGKNEPSLQQQTNQKTRNIQSQQNSSKIHSNSRESNSIKQRQKSQDGIREQKQVQNMEKRVKASQNEGSKEEAITKQNDANFNPINYSTQKEQSKSVAQLQQPKNLSTSSYKMDQSKVTESPAQKSSQFVARSNQQSLQKAKNDNSTLKKPKEQSNIPISSENLNQLHDQRNNPFQETCLGPKDLPPSSGQCQYPSKTAKPVNLCLPQQKNIEVQTDYLLPNSQQPEPASSQPYYKSRSDHLAKKKCKMNLCQPEIISTCNNINSSDNALREFNKKTRTEFIHPDSHEGEEEGEIEGPRPPTKQEGQRQYERQAYKNNAVVATQATNYFNDLRPQDHRESGKHSAFSNIFDLSYNADLRSSSHEHQQSSDFPPHLNREAFRLQFKNEQLYPEATHPAIINRLVYKNIPVVRAPVSTSLTCSLKKIQTISNALSFIERYLPDIMVSTTNKQRTQTCLFVNNQWMLFRSTSPFSLSDLLRSELREESVYKCIEAVTGMPMRVLRDKEQDGSNKRLVKSLKSLLQRREDEKGFQSVLYGVSRMSPEVAWVQKVRYFLDNSKQSKAILQCHRAPSKKREEICNIEADSISQFTQLFLLSNPKYLTLSVDPLNVNTYQIELSRLIFYVSGSYKFILYQETAKNEYKLIKESLMWLKHKNQSELTRFLLILQPIPQRQGQHVLTVRMALPEGEREGGMTNRVVKYENGGAAKGYQGGYENQKNLYLPVSREISE